MHELRFIMVVLCTMEFKTTEILQLKSNLTPPVFRAKPLSV